MSTVAEKLPNRNEVDPADTWDLNSLFTGDEAWEEAFGLWEGSIGEYAKFQGTLHESPAALLSCLQFDLKLDELADRLGTYAFLRAAEDQANSAYQRMTGRYQSLASKAAKAASFIHPELMAIENKVMAKLLGSPELAEYKLMLERILRYKPHTLGPKEEELLAMQGEMAGAAGKAYRQLIDADMKYGMITNEEGKEIELTNSSFISLLHSPDRKVREKTFHQFYGQITAHENCLSALLHGSVQKDIYYARVRNYPSAIEGAIFPDNVPLSVYDNLIASVRKNLPAVHRYYEVRRRKMGLKEIHHYDTYVPILSELSVKHTWDQAVDVIIAALAPLGTEYCTVLEEGLRGRWCDRYPNRGKQSGAFSSGVFSSIPYIMMNYKENVLSDVFTLAHEAGHSMHSWHSCRSQPYQYHNYVIFVAEVASTFNEQLLSHHMLGLAETDQQRAFLLNNEIDDIRSTVVRQTMFAEFEKITHEMAEAGEPLTVQAIKDVYRKLLEDYFGPDFALDDELSLECLRIPHFYRAFYVYKYATGMSAAIALSQRVLGGGQRELADYLGFLSGGGSKFPLDLLKGAGVDMTTPKPVDTALAHFASLVEELDQLI